MKRFFVECSFVRLILILVTLSLQATVLEIEQWLLFSSFVQDVKEQAPAKKLHARACFITLLC